jgi:hypothetical protein
MGDGLIDVNSELFCWQVSAMAPGSHFLLAENCASLGRARWLLFALHFLLHDIIWCDHTATAVYFFFFFRTRAAWVTCE